jgi:regulatory protein
MNQNLYNYAINLLSRQDYSEFKLKNKLRTRPDVLTIEINEVIEKLKGNHLLREENYKRLFIRKWLLKGESESKIRSRGKMEKLEIDTQDFLAISQELGVGNEDNISKLIEKKLRSKNIPEDYKEKLKIKDKILRFLISKGHSFDDAKSAISKYIS